MLHNLGPSQTSLQIGTTYPWYHMSQQTLLAPLLGGSYPLLLRKQLLADPKHLNSRRSSIKPIIPAFQFIYEFSKLLAIEKLTYSATAGKWAARFHSGSVFLKALTAQLFQLFNSGWSFNRSLWRKVETYVTNERSATVNLPPTSHFWLDRTFSRTPNTRSISFLYRSIALWIFSGWYKVNQAYWPKYGLEK